MSLDQNLFTLLLTQNKDNPHVVDLIDPAGMVHYRKQRLPGVEYKVEVYDPLSESLLITATAPAATSKQKTLELCNPTIIVELKYTGTLSFRWGFKWEEHEFEWKREECFMLRKPDPPVLVAITKEPAGRLKTTSVQILDYNLNRFDINDRKGLEIVILTALMTFQDSNETYHTPREEGSSSSSPALTSRKSSNSGMPGTSSSPPRPTPPPKPAPKTGVDRVKELQKGDYNEITVEEEGDVNDYAAYCANLIKDDAILFVTLRSAAAEQVPKVLKVVEQTKRIRHKEGLSDDTDLHQYVLYDTKRVGPKRIVLDDSAKTKYTPPDSLTVHLSKIDMPELQPKAMTQENSSGGSKKKDESKKKDASKKEEKKASKQTNTAPSNTRPQKKLGKSARSASPSSRIPSHQAHQNQSSPSPQSNSPSNYTPPPPIHHSTRPSHSNVPSISFPAPHTPNIITPQSPQHHSRPIRNSYHAGAGSPSLFSSYTPPPSQHTGPHPPHGLNIPPWQSGNPPPPPPPPEQKPASSLVAGIFERLQGRR